MAVKINDFGRGFIYGAGIAMGVAGLLVAAFNNNQPEETLGFPDNSQSLKKGNTESVLGAYEVQKISDALRDGKTVELRPGSSYTQAVFDFCVYKTEDGKVGAQTTDPVETTIPGYEMKIFKAPKP